ncbi:MAG: cytochrome c1 [Proteobacteria bacterium]|nr:cytochrome c1 [Pseudomonadota bacterium]NBX86393.1 cytochrome c1 [Pseudomonadota bacterium]
MKNLLLLAAFLITPLAHAGGGVEVPQEKWSFQGLQGKWDKDEIYRGYTVATQVCLACHSFKYINHRSLMRVGFTEAEVQTLAKALNMDINAKLISALDEASAKETYGKIPPDLSMMNKARAGGADYSHAVLVGYSEDPELIKHYLPEGVPQGAHFNKYFPGHAIAMPNPLSGPDMVTYHDGTSATVDQMSRDVSTFMQWTAEPERFERQHLGVYVLIYLFIFTILAFLTKRAIWKDIKKH